MAVFRHKNAEIYYELNGEGKNKPVITFINGLTQRVQHWKFFSDYFTARGYRVLLFDLLGQGSSLKPTLFIDFKDNQSLLNALLEYLKIDQIFVAGISFGGVVALRFAIEFPEKTKGIIPISTFSEMDGKMMALGTNMYEGMVTVGFEYLVKLLIPLNFSAEWIEKNENIIPQAVRESFSYNDLYAIQNMMESLYRFKGFTEDLVKIKCPALILNGEFDYLTPRSSHEILRKNIVNSKLIIMQKVCHAFTLEIPEMTSKVIESFLAEAENGKWKGDQSVWIANDDPKDPVLFFPCEGDYLRAVSVPKRKGEV